MSPIWRVPAGRPDRTGWRSQCGWQERLPRSAFPGVKRCALVGAPHGEGRRRRTYWRSRGELQAEVAGVYRRRRPQRASLARPQRKDAGDRAEPDAAAAPAKPHP